jgi:hypothetical protein
VTVLQPALHRPVTFPRPRERERDPGLGDDLHEAAAAALLPLRLLSNVTSSFQ